MRSTGIVNSLLVTCTGLVLGMSSRANGRHGVAVGLGALRVIALALVVAAYGSWNARLEAFSLPLKRLLERYLLLAVPIVCGAAALRQAAFANLALVPFQVWLWIVVRQALATRAKQSGMQCQ